MDGLPPTTPVTVECVVQAAATQRVSLAALTGILAQEDGRVGRVSRHPNGAVDYGPMQINGATWADDLKRYGVSMTSVTSHGCVNVLVGAWVLSQCNAAFPGEPWTAIGCYHRGVKRARDSRGVTYRRSVAVRLLRGVDLRQLVKRVNGS